MRGSPLIQTILIAAVFLLAAVPVWRLTRPATADAATVSAPAAENTPDSTTKPTPLDVEVVFSPAPMDFQVKCLDRTVLDGHGAQARFTTRWIATVLPEGVDLVVQAHWPAPGSAGNDVASATLEAMRVTVRFPDGRTVEKSFWAAHETVADVFTVPGTAGAPTP